MQEFKDEWFTLCSIYLLTKHYLLIAEEVNDDFSTILQPVKEHRDALDHIVRVFGTDLMKNKVADIDKYQLDNMSNAIRHVNRAFFDTADFLSYILRKQIRDLISDFSRDEIQQKYPDYPKLKQTLNDMPQKIAYIRENKDDCTKEELFSTVEQYRQTLDYLIKSYNQLCLLFD